LVAQVDHFHQPLMLGALRAVFLAVVEERLTLADQVLTDYLLVVAVVAVSLTA
jgi:hypothetical protein